MTSITTTGIVTIHRLKSGATVQLYLSANKSLSQYYDSASKSFTPSWSGENNGPQIVPIITGGIMSNAKWYLNMPVGTTGSARDQYEITTAKAGKVSVDDNGILTFTDNILTSEDTIANQTLTFICQVTAGGAPSEIQRTLVIDIRTGGQNSYWGHIEASNGTTLGKRYNGASEQVTSTVLKPVLTVGKTTMQTSQYTVKWYKTGAGVNGADLLIDASEENKWTLNGNNLTVMRDAVDGAAHFEAHFFVGGVEVEAEGIQIADNADTYFIAITGDTNVFSDNASNAAVLTAQVYETQTNKVVASVSKWEATATDSERMREYIRDKHYTLSTTDSKAVFRMEVGQMFVPNTEGNAFVNESKKWLKCGDSSSDDEAVATVSEATECEVIVQFTATI